MPKKLVKDLTLLDLKKICSNCDLCVKCPINFEKEQLCAVDPHLYPDEILEKEVEVDG